MYGGVSLRFRWSALRNEKLLKTRQRELHAHGEYDQSHKLRRRIV